MQPLVSIIMPAFNAGKYIAESIQSVLEQTYTKWELIVVDDGSTDNTGEIVRSFMSTERRIKYIFQQNSGQGKARNTAIENSSGELVAFLDSDDLWASDKLTLQLKVMEETKADLIFSDALIFSEGEEAIKTLTFSMLCPEFLYGRYGGTEMFRLLFAYNRIPTLTVLTRKDILKKVRLFDEKREYQNCEDYDLWLKLAGNGAVFLGMKESLAQYRRHSASMMNEDSRLLKPMIAVVKKHSQDSRLNDSLVKTTVKHLYRELISTLIEENKIGEAKDYMRKFSAWDRTGFTTSIQKLLIKMAPNQYNFISKECLYRIEWHMTRMFGSNLTKRRCLGLG